jgi:hypothetical protein
VGRRVKKKKKKWKKEGKLKEEKKKQKGKKKKEKREKRERGIMDISTFTQPGEAVLPNVSKNGFSSLAESAPPAQPQPEPPQPEPYQTDPKHGFAYVHLFTTKKNPILR